ncbi:MAG: AtpZ/AtpI family protein [Lachnospiraceae bacterium]|nr:AtpZ/AtpI family protein [Lachnospiraceae bacterium]
MKKNNHQVMRMIFLISQIGITMLTTIFLCMGIGYLIDHTFHTNLMVWFIVLGVFAGFKSAYMLIKRFIGREDE